MFRCLDAGDKRSQVSISGGSTLRGAKLDFFVPVCSVCVEVGDKRSQVSISGGSAHRGAKLDFFDPVCSVCVDAGDKICLLFPANGTPAGAMWVENIFLFFFRSVGTGCAKYRQGVSIIIEKYSFAGSHLPG